MVIITAQAIRATILSSGAQQYTSANIGRRYNQGLLNLQWAINQYGANVDRYDVPVIRIQPDVNDDCVGDGNKVIAAQKISSMILILRYFRYLHTNGRWYSLRKMEYIVKKKFKLTENLAHDMTQEACEKLTEVRGMPQTLFPLKRYSKGITKGNLIFKRGGRSYYCDESFMPNDLSIGKIIYMVDEVFGTSKFWSLNDIHPDLSYLVAVEKKHDMEIFIDEIPIVEKEQFFECSTGGYPDVQWRAFIKLIQLCAQTGGIDIDILNWGSDCDVQGHMIGRVLEGEKLSEAEAIYQFKTWFLGPLPSYKHDKMLKVDIGDSTPLTQQDKDIVRNWRTNGFLHHQTNFRQKIIKYFSSMTFQEVPAPYRVHQYYPRNLQTEHYPLNEKLDYWRKAIRAGAIKRANGTEVW